MKRAALYVRVSTDKQTVENQVARLSEVAQARGWQIAYSAGKHNSLLPEAHRNDREPDALSAFNYSILADFCRLCFMQSNRTLAAEILVPPFEKGRS